MRTIAYSCKLNKSDQLNFSKFAPLLFARYHSRIASFELSNVKSSALSPAKLYFDNEGTPVSCDFDDVYFSRENGLEESRHVFLQGNQLTERFASHQRSWLLVAETGFGSGLNFLALWQAFEQFRTIQPQASLKRLHVISFEKHPMRPEDLRQAHQHWPELIFWAKQLQQQWPLILPGCHRLLFNHGQITLDLWFGDINQTLLQTDASLYQQIDAWFLDGFSPAKNPDMWTDTLFCSMAKLTRPGGTAATFSVAGLVRRGLQQAGFSVQKRKGFARKREMLSARLTQNIVIPHPYPWYQRQPASSEHIAIIGGGIASALLALALLRRGLKVTLYCADSIPAQGASGNHQGALYPLFSPYDPAINRFFPTAFTFARRLYDALPVRFDHQWCAVTELAYNQQIRRKIRQILDSAPPASLAQAVSAQQASARCGVPLEHAGIEYPAAGWVCPAQLTSAILALAEQQGLQTHYQHRVCTIHYRNGWHMQFANGSQQQHPVLVLANGWQISQFSQTENLPVSPVAGQISHIPTSAGLKQLRQVLCYGGYLTPYHPITLNHCLGASHHRDEQQARYRLEDQQYNLQRLTDCLSQQSWPLQIDISANQARSSVRCAIRDHLPLVGNAPDYHATLAQYASLASQVSRPQQVPAAPYHPDLFLLGAFGSRGLCSAPLAAEILAAQISGEPMPLDHTTLNELNPNRLWIRKLLKGKPASRSPRINPDE